MKATSSSTRRDFLKVSVVGGLAALTVSRFPALMAAVAEGGAAPATQVALTTGKDRAEMAFQALKPFEKELRRAIGNRRIIIKPNNVAIDKQLAATHADCIEGTLEFLKSIGKLKNNSVAIAESAANGPTLEGFDNYSYTRLAAKFPVKLIDLDQEPVERVQVFDEKDFRPHPIRMSRLLLDRNNFIISAARMKTHDRIVATLSLKNIIFGAPIKDLGFGWVKGSKPGTKSDKPIAHGSGIRGINFNLFALAQRLHPDLAIIDGFDGMEGNGPVGGTAVDHKVCVVSPHWLAADRVAVELMGIEFAKVGYLNYCWQAGLGEGDLSKIEILGERVSDHIKHYKLADNIDQQMIWMKPPQQG